MCIYKHSSRKHQGHKPAQLRNEVTVTACIYTYILIGSHLSLKARLPLSLSRSAAKTVFLNQEEVWLFFHSGCFIYSNNAIYVLKREELRKSVEALMWGFHTNNRRKYYLQTKIENLPNNLVFLFTLCLCRCLFYKYCMYFLFIAVVCDEVPEFVLIRRCSSYRLRTV